MRFNPFNQAAKNKAPPLPDTPVDGPFLISELRTAKHPLAEAIDMIAGYSDLGKRIVGWAEKNKINFKLHTFKKTLGDYGVADRLIRAHTGNSVLLNFNVIAHELFHAIQDITKESLQDPDDASYHTLLARNHCLEAAAETCAVRIAYEAKLNGCAGPFNDVFENKDVTAYRPLYREFDEAYRKACAAGKSHDKAIEEASDSACRAWMASQRLKDSYNSGRLAHYVRDLIENDKSSTFPLPVFGRNGAKNLGFMNEKEFIADIEMPLTDSDLFGSNKLMKQAFEFVEFYHIFWWSDSADTNWGVCRKREELEQDDNPYLNAHDEYEDFHLPGLLKIYDEEYEENEEADMFEIMNEAAGIDPGIQLSFDFFKAVTQTAKAEAETKPAQRKQRAAAARTP